MIYLGYLIAFVVYALVAVLLYQVIRVYRRVILTIAGIVGGAAVLVTGFWISPWGMCILFVALKYFILPSMSARPRRDSAGAAADLS